MSPHVVGVDPSLTGTGIASNLGWCETVGITGVTARPLDERLRLVDDLVAAILTHIGKPDLVVIEQLRVTRDFTSGLLERHALWWMVVRALRRREVPVALVHAQLRVFYATGRWAGKKAVVIAAVAAQYPQYRIGRDDNLADAVVLCQMGDEHLRVPVSDRSRTHRDALARIAWPEITTHLEGRAA